MPVKFPQYIFGMHDPADEWMDPLMAARKQGWVLKTEGIGSDPNNSTAENYSKYSNKGFGVIVRLNNGYGNDGTIPTSDRYDDFAKRCRNWVANSSGANIWIIGNEPNLADERPRGQPITPALYAQCYQKCRAAIRSVAGHEDDLVVVGPVGPWNPQTTYTGNEKGDWIKYFSDILNLVKPNCDAIALHSYTHGTDPKLVLKDEPMASFPQYNFQFRAYRDFMRAIPPELRNLPVFITETQPTPDTGGWLPEARGWVSNAYKEINDWNSSANNQPIQCLLLFRWEEGNPTWSIKDKAWVRDDFALAIQNEYRVRMPGRPPVQPGKTYRVTWLGLDSPPRVAANGEALADFGLRNDSNFVWRADGATANPVRLGFRWFDSSGSEVSVRDGAHTPLPRDVQPGESVTVSNARLVAPAKAARYTLRWDLIEEGVTWFADAGSPAQDLSVEVVDGATTGLPVYAYSALSTNIPDTFPRDAQTNATLTLRNDGTKTWTDSGSAPVRLGYKWFRPNATDETLVRQLTRGKMPRDVPTGDSVTITVPVQAPFSPGQYNLTFDLVEETVTEFRKAGAQPIGKQVTVTAPPYYVSWLSVPVPDTLPIDQITTIPISIRNDGGKTWVATGDNMVRVAYNWFNERNEPVLVKQSLRASLPRDMAPGESVDVNLDVLTPDRPGNLTLRFGLVEERITFFTNAGSPPLDKKVVVKGTQEYQVTFGDVLTIVPPGALFTFNLKVRNDGTRMWPANGSNPVRVGYHWFDPAGQPVPVAQDLRSALPADVAPGQEVTVAARTVTPDQPGNYRLQWSLVAEGLAWFYDLSARTLDVPVQVAKVGEAPPAPVPVTPQPTPTPTPAPTPVPAVKYLANFPAHDVLRELDNDIQMIFRVRVRNDGSKTWLAGGDNPVHAGYRWYRGSEQVPVRADIRTALPGDIAPGQAADFGAQLVTPPNPGNYTLRFDLVEEGVTWFGDTGTSQPIEIPVQIVRGRQGMRLLASHNAQAASLAVDGDPATAWTSGQKMEPNMWFQLDLGAPRIIDGIAVRSGGKGFPSGYEVHISNDGANWQVVGVREKNWGDFSITFAPYAARFIKIVQTGETRWGAPWQIAEIAVHDARPWQATASHNPELAPLAFDDDPTTQWTCGIPQQVGMNYTLDMGVVQTISALTLENGTKPEYPQGYRIQLSADGHSWSVVAESSPAGNWQPLNVSFDAMSARYVYVECTASNRWHPWSISQLWVARDVADWKPLVA